MHVARLAPILAASAPEASYLSGRSRAAFLRSTRSGYHAEETTSWEQYHSASMSGQNDALGSEVTRTRIECLQEVCLCPSPAIGAYEGFALNMCELGDGNGGGIS